MAPKLGIYPWHWYAPPWRQPPARRLIGLVLGRAAAALGVYPRARNANRVDEADRPRSALLVYLPTAFLVDRADPIYDSHSNLRQCRQIASLLDERGYVVDVLHKNDPRFAPYRRYDLIISERLDEVGDADRFGSDAVVAFLATSLNHELHNRNVRMRHERMAKRRGCHLEVRRVHPDASRALARSDALLTFGNDFTVGTWRDAFDGPALAFNNYGVRQPAPSVKEKDFAAARSEFLFFATGSQMQKGLDLLLEVFCRHPRLRLHVCSKFERESDFSACYDRELHGMPNIHPVGWTSVHSADFDRLVHRCAYVIHPTCSEGQAGSVVQCMSFGLIPLVTKEAGIDTADFGITFPDDSLESIERVVLDASERPAGWHRSRTRRTLEVTRAEYSEAAFARRWETIITELEGLADSRHRGDAAASAPVM